MAPARVVDTILQVISGLEAAESAGILHRDIKPSNCFVDSEGTVRIGDFGLSISTLAGDTTNLTLVSMILGTPAYASPEQLRGKPLDVRADIYSVGATLYYLLTGEPPFDNREVITLLTRVATEKPRSPRMPQPYIPKGLAKTVLRCLKKDKMKRPASYAHLRESLLPFGSHAPAVAVVLSRIGAVVIDLFLVSLLLYAITRSFEHSNSRLVFRHGQLFSLVTVTTYFAVLEGFAGGSLGKLLTRISHQGL